MGDRRRSPTCPFFLLCIGEYSDIHLSFRAESRNLLFHRHEQGQQVPRLCPVLRLAPENLEFAGKPDATVLHLANFIEAVRTRQPSYETAEVGHHAAAAGHMVNHSYRSAKRMLWDAAKGRASEA